MVGTENNVRVDAEIYGEDMIQGTSIAIKYDDHQPALIADPDRRSDPADRPTIPTRARSRSTSARRFPGEEFLPRLISIPSGERRTFNTGAHINIPHAAQLPLAPKPRRAAAPRQLPRRSRPVREAGRHPGESACAITKLADELFPKWVERNETVTTNALPMRWQGPRTSGIEETPPARRRRGPGSRHGGSVRGPQGCRH